MVPRSYLKTDFYAEFMIRKGFPLHPTLTTMIITIFHEGTEAVFSGIFARGDCSCKQLSPSVLNSQPINYFKWKCSVIVRVSVVLNRTRYVDNTFTAVRQDEIDAFHHHLNGQNIDTQFTREVEENGKLATDESIQETDPHRQITRQVILQP